MRWTLFEQIRIQTQNNIRLTGYTPESFICFEISRPITLTVGIATMSACLFCIVIILMSRIPYSFDKFRNIGIPFVSRLGQPTPSACRHIFHCPDISRILFYGTSKANYPAGRSIYLLNCFQVLVLLRVFPNRRN